MFAFLCGIIGFAAGAMLDKIIFCIIVWMLIARIKIIATRAKAKVAAKAAGLYTVVTPSYWTRTEDFSGADLVLPSLGSAERPLMPRAAALVGHTMLGIREICLQLDALREFG